MRSRQSAVGGEIEAEGSSHLALTPVRNDLHLSRGRTGGTVASESLVQSRRPVKLDQGFRFEPSRRVLQISVSPAEQAF
jgi:hypothetical protein